MRFEMNRDYLTGECMESLENWASKLEEICNCDACNEGYEKGRCKINYMYGYDIY